MFVLALRNELDQVSDTQVNLRGTMFTPQAPIEAPSEEAPDFSDRAKNIVAGIPQFFKGLIDAVAEDFGASITPSDSDLSSEAYQWGTGTGHAITETVGQFISGLGKVLGGVAILCAVNIVEMAGFGQKTVVIGAIDGEMAKDAAILIAGGEVLQARSQENSDKARKKFRESGEKTKKEGAAEGGKKGGGKKGKGEGGAGGKKSGEPGKGKPGEGASLEADTRNGKLTKEQLETKPKHSRTPESWAEEGGHITIDKDGIWTYHDKEGHSVSYPDGYPDFKSAGLVEREVELNEFRGHDSDKGRANTAAKRKYGVGHRSGYTWHHNQDMHTMQEVETSIHKKFTHEGGVSLIED